MTLPADEVAPDTTADPRLVDLFVAFSSMALMGFGGVLPWARRELVEQRRWLTADEFTETLSLGQFLPGANIVNMSVVIGQRFGGVRGALVCLLGLLVWPILIVVALGSIYLRYAHLPGVHQALSGVAAAAAGLILATAAKMAAPLLRRGVTFGLATAVVTFVAIGLFKLPLLYVLAVVAPVSVAHEWRRLR